jgi:hypothetical protein
MHAGVKQETPLDLWVEQSRATHSRRFCAFAGIGVHGPRS